MDEHLVVNVEVRDGGDGPQDVVKIPFDISWEDFHLLLKLTFDLEKMTLTYMDEDNDEIMLSCHEELTEAFKVARQNLNTLQLIITPPAKAKRPLERVAASEYITQPFSDEQETTSLEDKTLGGAAAAMPQTASSMDVEATHTLPAPPPYSEVDDEDVAMETEKADREKLEKHSSDESVIVETTEVCESSDSDTAEITPKLALEPLRLFRLRSMSAKGMSLDACGWGKESGTPVIVWDSKIDRLPDNQTFYEHKVTGTVRSAFNGLCLDANGDTCKLVTFDAGKTSQQWSLIDKKLQHRFNPNWVISTDPAPGQEGKHLVHAAQYIGEDKQHWMVDYLPSDGDAETSTDNQMYGNSSRNVCKRLPMARKEKTKEYYTQLAREFGRSISHSSKLKSVQGPKGRIRLRGRQDSHESATRGLPASLDLETPPAWFINYMQQFQQDLVEEISLNVARQTVSQVLKGLEGAVITSVRGTSGIGAPATTPVAGTSASTAPTKTPIYCHFGVICDNCDETIVGVRFKCGNCEDFDLCEKCEALEGIHDPEHVFIKIRKPTMAAGRKHNGQMAPLLKRPLYATEEEIDKLQQKIRRKEEKEKKREERAEEKLQKEEKKWEERMSRREKILKLKRSLEQTKDTPHKKERLDLPQFKTTEKMGAEFICDITIPDGTHLQPGTKFMKRWSMRNTGTHPWTSSTKLKLMWGNIPTGLAEVSVPYLQPGIEGAISVEFTAPMNPGVYQSHWRLCHHSTRFGHRVWCSIVVDCKEMLEPLPKQPDIIQFRAHEQLPEVNVECVEADNAQCDGQEPEEEHFYENEENMDLMREIKTTNYGKKSQNEDTHIDESRTEDEDESAVVLEAAKLPSETTPCEELQAVGNVDCDVIVTVEDDTFTAQDILSFELLEIQDREKPKASQTATPNNTPLVASPPKSPIQELDLAMQQLSASSSVEIVSAAAEEEERGQITQLVHERIHSLGLKPASMFDNDDIETLSSCSEDSNDSDSDFYIVPLPDCFNPNYPPSTSSSTSVIVKGDEKRHRGSDEPLSIETTPLLSGEGDGASIQSLQSLPNSMTESTQCVLVDPVPDFTAETQEGEDGEENVEVTYQLLEASACVDTPDIEETEDEMFEVKVTTPEVKVMAPEVKVTSAENEDAVEDDTDENGNSQEQREVVRLMNETAEGEEEQPREEPEQQGAEGGDAVDGMTERDRQNSGEFTAMVSVALGAASHAAAAALTTAKDVFHTLQARNQYVPPKSNWTPPKSTFRPPQQSWTPQSATWPPSVPTPGNVVPVVNTPSTPMEHLLEMGFADRSLNQSLLDKYENDLERTIQDLCQQQDTDWPETRH